jgi:hypothetical protein
LPQSEKIEQGKRGIHMDENIRSNVSVLTPEDVRLLVKYADTIITEEGAEVPAAAEVLAQIICSTPPELVENIYKLQPTKRLIVVTRSKMAADLANVLAGSLTENHFALYADGTWYANAAIKEIRALNSKLTSKNGDELSVEKEIIPGVYASSDGRILAAEGHLEELGGEPLYDKHFHDVWGTLLPAQYSMTTLAGEDISFTTRTFAVANLLAQMRKRDDGKVPVPERTLVFGQGHCLVTGWAEAEDQTAALRRLIFLQLFGAEESDDVLASILPVLDTAENVPAAFLSDLEQIYLNNTPCSFRKWNNIIERLMIDYEENGVLKGGAAE